MKTVYRWDKRSKICQKRSTISNAPKCMPVPYCMPVPLPASGCQCLPVPYCLPVPASPIACQCLPVPLPASVCQSHCLPVPASACQCLPVPYCLPVAASACLHHNHNISDLATSDFWCGKKCVCGVIPPAPPPPTLTPLYYRQWWAQLTKTLASITGNPLTEKLASITLNR